ncbi:MAG TPA: NAD(P)-binding protein, partial [Myxococcales bacterium]|nr:NAD(P)-binding protein [Myxococcales bacterium]
MRRAVHRTFAANLRYLWALVARFRVTVILGTILFLAAPLAFRLLYVGPGGERITYGAAIHHVYFLLYGQPSLPYVGIPVLEALNVAIPPFGIIVLVDGMVRFAYLYFAKHRDDKEWIAVLSQTMRGHVVVCGAGRIGFRVCEQLLTLGREVSVIEKREDAPFVAILRDRGVPVLIDDIKSPGSLKRTNVEGASAIVCATDDDLANLNVALDARKMNPGIRVVIRLFDDDLVAKVRETFKAEALSSSALAAPAMALSALDPRILHSFQMNGYLLVISRFTADHGLPELTLSEVRDKFGGLTLALERTGTEEVLHPRGNTRVERGDVLTLQLQYE